MTKQSWSSGLLAYARYSLFQALDTCRDGMKKIIHSQLCMIKKKRKRKSQRSLNKLSYFLEIESIRPAAPRPTPLLLFRRNTCSGRRKEPGQPRASQLSPILRPPYQLCMCTTEYSIRVRVELFSAAHAFFLPNPYRTRGHLFGICAKEWPIAIKMP